MCIEQTGQQKRDANLTDQTDTNKEEIILDCSNDIGVSGQQHVVFQANETEFLYTGKLEETQANCHACRQNENKNKKKQTRQQI